jgi:hypothetical protein
VGFIIKKYDQTLKNMNSDTSLNEGIKEAILRFTSYSMILENGMNSLVNMSQAFARIAD